MDQCIPFGIEKFLKSSNGTGRKEKGLHGILFSLKKQHSLFAELLDMPILDYIRAEWTDSSLKLTSNYGFVNITNIHRSFFVKMCVKVEENGVAGMPNIEPLNSFMSPNKPYRYSSEGLNELLKREIRSIDKQLLIRWFWIENNIINDPNSPSNKSCEVIVQFALSHVELRKRKRSEFESGFGNVENSNYMERMLRILENIYAVQQAHFAKVEALLSSLHNQPQQDSLNLSSNSYQNTMNYPLNTFQNIRAQQFTQPPTVSPSVSLPISQNKSLNSSTGNNGSSNSIFQSNSLENSNAWGELVFQQQDKTNNT